MRGDKVPVVEKVARSDSALVIIAVDWEGLVCPTVRLGCLSARKVFCTWLMKTSALKGLPNGSECRWVDLVGGGVPVLVEGHSIEAVWCALGDNVAEGAGNQGKKSEDDPEQHSEKSINGRTPNPNN